MKDDLATLTELLRELPGIGPRQARRLALWLVRRNSAWVERLSATLLSARTGVRTCTVCTRLFPRDRTDARVCTICRDPARNTGTLMLVEKDISLENVERTGVYRGHYFVLGGTVNHMDSEPERHIRLGALMERLGSEEYPVRELIFALSATTEGEETAHYVREKVATLLRERGITASELGRGLSTGTELEYVDVDTMKNALKGRH